MIELIQLRGLGFIFTKLSAIILFLGIVLFILGAVLQKHRLKQVAIYDLIKWGGAIVVLISIISSVKVYR